MAETLSQQRKSTTRALRTIRAAVHQDDVKLDNNIKQDNVKSDTELLNRYPLPSFIPTVVLTLISSQAFEAYLTNLSSKLSLAERQLGQKLMRRIKNREAAARSRQRQVVREMDLASFVKTLQVQNHILANRVTHYANQLQSLTKTVKSLQSSVSLLHGNNAPLTVNDDSDELSSSSSHSQSTTNATIANDQDWSDWSSFVGPIELVPDIE